MMWRNLSLVAMLICSVGVSAAGKSVPMVHYFDEQDGLAKAHVSAVIQDRDGYIWLATWDGLKRYDGYRFKSYKLRPGDGSPMATSSIYNILELKDGNILCETSSAHYIFNKSTRHFQSAATPNGHLPRYRAKAADAARWSRALGHQVEPGAFLCVDRQGGVWGYERGSLFRLWQKADLVTLYSAHDRRGEVRALFVDAHGRLWIGDRQGYVSLTDQRGRELGYLTPRGRISSTPEQFGEVVYCFYEDSQGSFWLGCKPGGLYRLRPRADGFDVAHFGGDGKPWSLNDNSIYAMVEDPRHHLWIGTWYGGLNVISDTREAYPRFVNMGNRLKRYPKEARQVRCLSLIDNRILLIGTSNGLLTCDVNQPVGQMAFHANTRSSTRKSSLSDNNITSIVRTRGHEVYVATYGGGVNKVLSANLLSSNIEFANYNTDNGLPSDAVHALVEDGEGQLWVVSDGAFCRLNKRMRVFDNYVKELFSGQSYSLETEPVVLPNGDIALGTSKGIVRLSPTLLSKQNYTPPIIFDCPDSIMLSPSEKTLEIEFAAIDYNQVEAIRYAYQVDGIDSTWVYTSEPKVRYTSIPPGSYRLRVRSTNGQGVWRDNENTVFFHRKASFNETPFAWILYSSLLLLSFFVVFKVVAYIRRLNREISDLQVSTAERVAYLTGRIEELLTFRSTGEKRRDTIQPTSMPKDFKEKLEKFILDKLSDSSLSVNDIASEMGMSRSVLYLNVRRAFGCTVNEKLFNMRMKKAAQMLDETDRSVSDIAYACGFSDPKYFSRSFKKSLGLTPSEYQNRDRQKEG